MTFALYEKGSDFSDDWKRRCIDALTVTTFFTVVGAINEFYIAGLRPDQVLTTRMVAIPLLLVSGAAYGIYRDIVLRLIRFSERDECWRTVIDTCTCLSFRVPLYAAIIMLGGARGNQLIYGLLGATIIILFCGRPCGWCIDRVRALCGVQGRTAQGKHKSSVASLPSKATISLHSDAPTRLRHISTSLTNWRN